MSENRSKTSFLTKIDYKSLIFLHLFVAAGICSLFYILSHHPYTYLDEKCFRLLNGWVENSFFWQNFWAMANHRLADWVEDVCFLIFFYFVIKSCPKAERIRKAAECIFLVLFCASMNLLANELLFRELLNIKRNSPTLIFDSFTNLSAKITWLKVKVKSPKSFPGDHATLALSFIVGFLYVARHNIKITVAAILYGLFLCLPRLVVGAHWITDIMIGSGSIVLIFFGWAFCTPLASVCIQKIENLLRSGFLTRFRKRIQPGYDL